MAEETTAAEETPIIAGLPNELAHLAWLIGRWVGVINFRFKNYMIFMHFVLKFLLLNKIVSIKT